MDGGICTYLKRLLIDSFDKKFGFCSRQTAMNGNTSIGSKEKELVLAFLTRAINYLELASNVFQETKGQGNRHMLISDEFLSQEEYNERTKWSDFRVIEPTLFCFYHGLELTMKGLLLLSGVLSTTFNREHKLTKLLRDTDMQDSIPLEIRSILRAHLDESRLSQVIKGFLDANNLDLDGLYNALRFPSDPSFDRVLNYFSLHYQERDSMDYFSRIIDDIKSLRRQVVSFYRSKRTQN